MNESIRQAVAQTLEQQHVTRAELARQLKRTPQEITRALNGTTKGGTVPPLWRDIFEHLCLELVVQPKRDA